jgi:hypothetical protein
MNKFEGFGVTLADVEDLHQFKYVKPLFRRFLIRVALYGFHIILELVSEETIELVCGHSSAQSFFEILNKEKTLKVSDKTWKSLSS